VSYEAWRATFQSSEQAARAAYRLMQTAVAQERSEVNIGTIGYVDLDQECGAPETRLKMAGMIDLYDEDEPENKETVHYGLLLEFDSREAMAEAFEKGVCRFSFGFSFSPQQEAPVDD